MEKSVTLIEIGLFEIGRRLLPKKIGEWGGGMGGGGGGGVFALLRGMKINGMNAQTSLWLFEFLETGFSLVLTKWLIFFGLPDNFICQKMI